LDFWSANAPKLDNKIALIIINIMISKV